MYFKLGQTPASSNTDYWVSMCVFSKPVCSVTTMSCLLSGFIVLSSLRTFAKKQYPFELKVVAKDGYSCAICPWYK